MKKMIRWQGITYFGVLAALLVFFAYFFIDDFVARQIEKLGSAMVGARVELAEADLSFFPAGLELKRLQVTNPDAPMRNAVEIDRIAMTINSLRLLEKKLIIEEMAAEGIRPDTPRKRSGALPEYRARQPEAPAAGAEKGFEMPKLEIPEVKEVLAREKLTSLELTREYRENLQTETARWRERLAELPDQEKLNGYRERLEKLRGGGGLSGLLGGATDLVALRKELQADLDRLRAARDDLGKESQAYRERFAKLQKAPLEDIERLVAKYTPSSEGLANLSSLLFGGKAGRIVQKSLFWYEKIQPLLARTVEKKDGRKVIKPIRGKGVWVKFEEENPLPGFLIRRLAASVEIEAGSFAGTIENLTPDQDILGVPLSYDFGGDSLRGLRAIHFDGIFNHVNPDRPVDTVNLAIQGYAIRKTELSDNETLPVTIAGGLADLDGQAVLRDKDIDGDLSVLLTSADFIVDSPQSRGAVTEALAESLAGIANVSARAEIEGSIDDYRLRVSSDLDKVLKNAVARTIKNKTAEFKENLRSEVMAKVEEPLAAAQGDLVRLGDISEQITARLQLGNSLLR